MYVVHTSRSLKIGHSEAFEVTALLSTYSAEMTYFYKSRTNKVPTMDSEKVIYGD
jgi:hypothetical protein